MQSANVTAVLEGSGKAFQAYTNKDGKYSIDIPAGDVKVRASHNGSKGKLSKFVNVTVPDGGNTAADLQLLDFATVNYKLYTALNGVKEGPVDFDWRVSTHYHMETSLPILSYGPPFQVNGVAGDKFRVCVDGREAGMPAACDEVTIPDSNQAELEMTLQGIGAQVTASYINEEKPNENNVNLQVFRYEEGGKLAYKYVNTRRVGGKYLIDIPEPGHYRLVAYGEGGKSAVTEFEVVASDNKELPPQKLSAKGKFAGQEGSGIYLSRDLTTPGNLIVARVIYANRDPLFSVTAEQAVVTVDLPEGLEYVPSSIVVRGESVEGTLSGGKLTVPVGTIFGGIAGAVQFSLKAKEQSLNDATFMASISYKGAPQEERLGSATIRLAYATIQAPEVIAKKEFTVSGISFPGAKVDVYDGDQLLGEAQVSEQGRWMLDIQLPNSETSNHELRTFVQMDGHSIAGQTALVRVDPDDPGMEQVSMRQGGGRVQTFRTDSGIAVFPFVYVPGEPFQYKLTFRTPDRISNVHVWMGSESAPAVRVGDDFVTSMILKGDPGPISVTYDKKMKGIPENPPTEQELRNTLPHPLRNYEVDWLTLPGETTPEGQTLPPGTISSLINLTEDIKAKVTITQATAADSTPTAQESQKMEQTGIPAFGISITQATGNKSGTFTMKMKVPESIAAALAGETNFASDHATSLRNLNLKNVKDVTFIIDVMNHATTTVDMYNLLMSSVSPSVLDRINADIEAARTLCDPKAAEFYGILAKLLKYDVIWTELFKSILGIASSKVPGAGGLILWFDNYIASKIIDDRIESQFNELEYYLKKNECKLEPFDPKKKRPLADPKYIYDPSGYVYEGMTGNRLEGVTATALELDPDSGSWNEWDASWYEQVNPQTTDLQGKYGWDVPRGKWKIRYEKAGYETAYSEEMDVPPPRFEVNIPLVSNLPAKIDSIRAYPAEDGTRIKVGFTKPIDITGVDLNKAVTITEGLYTSDNTAVVAGTVEAVNSETVGGKTLTMELEFTPTSNLTAGGEYGYAVSGSLISYAGVPIGGDLVGTVIAGDSAAPQEVQELSASISGGKATVMWSIPYDDKSNQPADRDLKVFKITVTEQGKDDASYEWTVPASQKWAVKEGLSDTQAYAISVSAVDEWGNESKAASQVWVPAARQDWAAPPSVTGLKVNSINTDRIEVSWKASSAPDLDHYIVGWSEKGGKEQVQSVSKSETSYTIPGLKPGTDYVISVLAVDGAGNKSGADSLTAATKSAGGGNNGGGNGGGGSSDGGNSSGGSNGGANQTDAFWTIPTSGGTFRTSDGKWQLEVPNQAFAEETKLEYLSKPDGVGKLPAGYQAYSGTLLLNAGSTGPAKSLKLAVSYDPAALGSMDPRRLGLYVKDASAPAGWRYIGGSVDIANHRVLVQINELGEYALLVYNQPFGDMIGHWSLPEVSVLVSRHIVSGVSETAFEPERQITRAEVTKLLVSLLQLRTTAAGETIPSGQGTAFADVSGDAWYAPYVKLAAASGLVQGENGKFRPEDPVTREELALLFTRFAKLAKLSLSEPDENVFKPFRDADRLSDWAKASFAQAVAMGWIRGVEEDAADPAGEATRAQAAVMLLRVLESLGE